jgi:Domain of unknown function (DUF1707)
MSTQARGFPSGEMRASDADRDLALAELSEHFQTGRLTQEEFDERSARALQAKTGRELSELFTDLPEPAQPGGAALGGTDPAGLGGPAGSAGPWGPPDPSPSGPPWQGPSWPGPSSWPGPGPLGRAPSRRRPVPFVIVGVVAAIAVTNLLGHAAHVTIGPVGIGFGWVIPVVIVLVGLRRLARRR